MTKNCDRTLEHVLILISCGGVRLWPFGTLVTLQPIVPAPDDRCWWLWSGWWNVNWQGKLKYSERKPAPVPLCPPQIPHDLIWNQTRATPVGSQQLTTWRVAQPLEHVRLSIRFCRKFCLIVLFTYKVNGFSLVMGYFKISNVPECDVSCEMQSVIGFRHHLYQL
jgi:hypothetical protein